VGEIYPVNASCHGTGNDSFGIGKKTKGKHLRFHGSHETAVFRSFEVPDCYPAIAAARKPLAGRRTGAQRVNRRVVTGACMFFNYLHGKAFDC
jgi:hypothetical protein